MKNLRILVLAPGSNPNSLSTALVGYAHSEALARLHAVTLVANGCHEAALRRKPTPFLAIELISTPWLDRIYGWIIQYVFKGDYGSHLLTALVYPFSVVFEWKAWRLLRPRIKAGEFDVVLRLLPVVPTLPSPFAFFLRRGPIPFVIGPINGGLPWPSGFSQAEKQKEWITGLRNLYRVLPFARSTYRHATAIIAGSSQTYAEFSTYREKLFFVPENGLSQALLDSALPRIANHGVLELIYVGRLVPYKACDLALRAAVPLLQKGLARLTIVGDGPERTGLEQLAETLGVAKEIAFVGWLGHSETMQQLQKADVLVFPSIREFGGGVVFEALALGVVPVVADFGGPGDIVHSGVGYKVSLTNESDMVCQIEKILSELAGDRSLLDRLSQEGMKYARENLSWDGKAQVVTTILSWAVGKGPKPDLPPPKELPQQCW
jgi:glycosyltransferase involved in cell wall biosynthesis